MASTDAIDDRFDDQLTSAIDTVKEARLRAIITRLMKTVPGLKRELVKELVYEIPAEKEKKGKRRREVVSRWRVCENCEEEFDAATERVEDECHFHPEYLEPDEDMFADWDESCHGPIDTEENQSEYPENFRWVCCEETTLSEGCERGMHIPRAETAKKRKL